jgi:putative flavoprotein involved in K+ transport
MLIRVKPLQIAAAGIERTTHIPAVVDGRPQAADGVLVDLANVIWCTGFLPDFDWIDLPGLDSSGRLLSRRGSLSTAGPSMRSARNSTSHSP